MRRQTQHGNLTCLKSQRWTEHVARSLAREALASLGTSGSPTVCSAVTCVSFVYCSLWWATRLEDVLPHVTARACTTLMVTAMTQRLWELTQMPGARLTLLTTLVNTRIFLFLREAEVWRGLLKGGLRQELSQAIPPFRLHMYPGIPDGRTSSAPFLV